MCAGGPPTFFLEISSRSARLGRIDGLEFVFCTASCHVTLLFDPTRDAWCIATGCDEDRAPESLLCSAHQCAPLVRWDVSKLALVPVPSQIAVPVVWEDSVATLAVVPDPESVVSPEAVTVVAPSGPAAPITAAGHAGRALDRQMDLGVDFAQVSTDVAAADIGVQVAGLVPAQLDAPSEEVVTAADAAPAETTDIPAQSATVLALTPAA
jgi:hypothetical protein